MLLQGLGGLPAASLRWWGWQPMQTYSMSWATGCMGTGSAFSAAGSLSTCVEPPHDAFSYYGTAELRSLRLTAACGEVWGVCRSIAQKLKLLATSLSCAGDFLIQRGIGAS